MEIEVNKSFFGFKVLDIQEVQDIDSLCYVFEHEKSGAKLFYAKNNDSNKVFFISFKTPPLDDCGTAHILEHSVLCGSKKYPAKDPFNELMKGSLNTYLNALTYSDKTMYPVASCNHESFKTLMDVYLDAVFNPNVLTEEKIFKQEGWHYEIKSEDEPVSINGVVYNEMKGAMSSPERVLNNAINKSLFQESIYRFESGGDPDAIPNLTYEGFIEFYNRYYHPSNSFIYLYGDMNIEECLEHLNEEYLSKYERRDMKFDVLDEPEKRHRGFVSDTFSVPVGTKTDNESMLSLNFIVGHSTDSLVALSMEILNYVLLETGASPLKKVIVEKKIAESAEGWFDSSSYQMVLSIVAKNSSCKKLGLFKEKVMSTLERLSEEGLDRDLVLGAVNYYEFMLREADYGYRPKGLAYGMEMMKGWLHGQNPIEAVKIYEHLDRIRQGINEGYFEGLIKKYLLTNSSSSVAAIAAEEGKQERDEERLRISLEEYKNSLSEGEKEKLIKETKDLDNYQSQQDPEEIISKIPVVKKEEIDKKADYDDFNKIDGCIFLPQNTSGIVYSKMLFSTESVPYELIPYAGLLGRVLGKLDTQKYTFDSLSKEINMYTGGVSGRLNVYTEKEGIKPVIAVSGKALVRNIDKLFNILDEVIFNTDFSKHCSLRKIMLEIKSEYERYFDNNGHMAALKRCTSMLDEEGAYNELSEGIVFNDALLKALENIEETAQKLRETARMIFTKDNFISVLSCEEKDFENALKYVKMIESKTPDYKLGKIRFEFKKGILKEAIETGGKVVYNALACDFKKHGFEFDGKMNVIKNIINTEFLWNQVRVRGGAYGCGSNFLRNGKILFYSYRDPNIKDTFETFKQTPVFLRNINLSERDLTKYTLGAVNTIDKPKSKAERLEGVVSRFFLGLTREDVQKSRDEMLSLKEKDLRDFADIIEKSMLESALCTFGSELKIKENDTVYESIRQLYNK